MRPDFEIRTSEGYAGDYLVGIAEEEFFSHLFRRYRPSVYLEIGTRCGILLARLAGEYRETSFQAVDPFILGEDYAKIRDCFKQNTEHLDNIRLYEMTSNEAVGIINDNIDILFIDGDHSYEQCYEDCINYFPLVNNGGFAVIHDFTLYDSVREATLRFVSESSDVAVNRIVDSSIIIQKKKPFLLGNRARIVFFRLINSLIYRRFTARKIMKLFGWL